ncbi:SOS response-associated peptidase [Acetobacter estunensis]|uniref:SOS response-associated peptidase n=1 Tax=Acetobacter estunensis TaxID=104097 RepID=UPI001C2DBAF0|nr:SOS response-associated peptidase [Acetobacter estunensis]MBV1835794.1 SOS response-associated peptidase [Acetobacter estunensis]MBV1835945.1 SOS response-associated peptidase [Acetobacter estunensis]
MCGRFANDLTVDLMRTVFGITGTVPNWPPSWNIAPSQQAPVVRLKPETEERHLDLLRWGFIPHWAKDAGRQPINARAETAATSSLFRSAFENRRALVPATAYYEWQKGSSPRQPWAFRRKNGQPLAIAGLWENWQHDGEWVRTFVILTTRANALMNPIHDRMPVTIEEDDWSTWLGGAADSARSLLHPTPDDALECYPVSRNVNTPANNSASLLAPI